MFFSLNLNGQSARDKLMKIVKNSTSQDLPKLLTSIINNYEGVTSNTSLFQLENRAFEISDSDVCEVAFLQIEKSENSRSKRRIIYSLNLADVDAKKMGKNNRTDGIFTIPMMEGKTVFAEAFVADKKSKEAHINAFDIASPIEPNQLKSDLRQLVEYCKTQD